MNSKEEDASKYELLRLIYLHLKENGYQKAANALKKHVTQNETAAVVATLHDIYKSWAKTCNSVKIKEEPGIDPVKLDLSGDFEKLGEDEDSTPEKTVAATDTKPIIKMAGTPINADAGAVDTQPPKDSDTPLNGVAPISEVGSGAPSLQAKPAPASESSEEEAPLPQKPLIVPEPTPLEASNAPSIPSSKKTESSDSESEAVSEDEVPPSQICTGPWKLKPADMQGVCSLCSDRMENKTATSKAMPSKAPTTLTATSKAESSSEDSDREEETSAAKKVTFKKPVATPTAASKSESSDSDSEEETPVQKAPATSKAAPAKGASVAAGKPGQPTLSQTKAASKTPASGKKAKSSESESSDESESEEEAAPLLKKMKAAPKAVTVPTVAKAKAKATPTPLCKLTPKASPATEKVEESESADSSDSETEAPPKKLPATAAKPIQPSPSLAKAEPKAPAVAKAAERSEGESTDESESEDEKAPPKKKPTPIALVKVVAVKIQGRAKVTFKATPKPAAPKKREDESSDSSGSEDEGSVMEVPVSSKAVLAMPETVSKSTSKTPVPSKEGESSSDDSSEEEEAPPAAVKTPTVAATASAASAAACPATPASPDRQEEEDPIPAQEVTELKSPEPALPEATSAPVEPSPENSCPGGEEPSQSPAEPAAAPKNKTGKKKGKKKKTATPAVPVKGKTDTPAPPSLIKPSLDTSPIDLDELIAEARKAAEDTPKAEEVSEGDAGHLDTKSITLQPVADEVPVEATVETPLADAPTVETPALLAKRKRVEEETELPAKKKKKKKKKMKTAQSQTETVKNEHPVPPATSPAGGCSESSKKVNVEKKQAFSLSDEDVAALDGVSPVNCGSTTIILSAKSLKKKKKMMKKKMMAALLAKEATVENATPKIQKKDKTPRKNKAPASATVSPQPLVTVDQSAAAKAKPGKRPFPTPDTSEMDEQETPIKKKKSDKKGKKKTNPQPETPLPSPPKKKKKKKKAKQLAFPDEMDTTAEKAPPSTAENSSPVSEKKKKNKKNKLKETKEKMIKKTPFKPPAGLNLDTPSSLESSPALPKSATGKKKKSSKNK